MSLCMNRAKTHSRKVGNEVSDGDEARGDHLGAAKDGVDPARVATGEGATVINVALAGVDLTTGEDVQWGEGH